MTALRKATMNPWLYKLVMSGENNWRLCCLYDFEVITLIHG
jgi:hypothetical protein